MNTLSTVAPLLLLALTACSSDKEADSGAEDTDTSTADTDTAADDSGGNGTDTGETDTTDTADTGAEDTGSENPGVRRVTVELTNPSFEALAGMEPADFTTETPEGWNYVPLTSDPAAVVGTFCPPETALDEIYPLAAPAEGNNVLWMAGHGGGGSVHPSARFPGTAFRASDILEARVAVAKRNDAGISGTGNAFIELTADGFGRCGAYAPTYAELSAVAGEWVEAWVRCSALEDGTLNGTLSFGVTGLSNRNDQVLFDNVRVTLESAE